MKSYLLLLPLLFLLLACNTEPDEVVPTPTGDVLIRVENASFYSFENILVNTDANYEYGNLNEGERSDYQAHGIAYDYAYVSLEIMGSQFVIQPIDYVGETPLTAGSYTYILTFDDIAQQLFIELREDG